MTTSPLVDHGNRAFWTLVGVVVAFRGVLGVLACCVVGVVATRIVAAGAWVLWRDAWMLPAALLAALLIASSAAAVIRFTREIHANAALDRRLRQHAVPVDPRVRDVAARLGVAGRVCVVKADEPYAFTHRLVGPRVVLGAALVRSLEDDELAAVLAHEAAHVRSRDPLKVLVTRVLVARAFYLPALRHLASRFVAGRELAADRQAVRHCGERALAGALMRTLGPPRWAATTPAAAMASAASLDARITQLETGAAPPLQRTPRLLLAGTLAVAVAVIAAAGDAAILVQRICMQGM